MTKIARNRTSTVMYTVLAALTPGLIAQAYFFGFGVLLNGIILSVLCVLIEVSIVLARRPVNYINELSRHIGDGSTLLTAWLIAVCLPPSLPISVLAVAALAAIGLAKHAYGGLGQNVFNPAMVGYAVILLSFPALMATYPSAGTDGLSGATLLSDFRYRGGTTVAEFMPGVATAAHHATLTAGMFLLGGLWLLFRRIISWRIPTTMLLTVGFLAAVTYDQGSSQSLGSPWFHWTTGGTIAAAFFFATDPVTHPANPRHQILFGCLIGVILFVIRTGASLPDGIAFAILLANCTTPLFNRMHQQPQRAAHE